MTQLLAANATVRIFGCIVAAQPVGERFLAYFANIQTTDWAVFHWDNSAGLPAVTAVVMPGGVVTLQNAKYLDTKITQAKDALLVASKESLARDPFSETVSDWSTIRVIERLIRKGAPQYDPGIGPS